MKNAKTIDEVLKEIEEIEKTKEQRLDKKLDEASKDVLKTNDSKVRKQIKLTIIEKLRENKELEFELLDILNYLNTDKYEKAYKEIEELVYSKILQIGDPIDIDDYETREFNKEEAVAIGYIERLVGYSKVYIFDLNAQYGFVGFDKDKDIIKAKKGKISVNENGVPYLCFEDGSINLKEVEELE